MSCAFATSDATHWLVASSILACCFGIVTHSGPGAVFGGVTALCPPPPPPPPDPVGEGEQGTLLHTSGFAPVVTQPLSFCTQSLGQQTCASPSPAQEHTSRSASVALTIRGFIVA